MSSVSFATLHDELQERLPGLAKRAKRGAMPAIRLFCLECQGGVQGEVLKCSADCFLRAFRLGRGPVADSDSGKSLATKKARKWPTPCQDTTDDCDA